jgi:hypothetical protein
MKENYIQSRGRGISYIQGKEGKANWIGHILCGNCFLKHVILEKLCGRKEMTERRGRRRKEPLNDVKE